MDFWKLNQSQGAPAAIDARTGQSWTYAKLGGDVQQFQDRLPRLGRRTLGLLLARNRYECLVAYLAALRSDSALILVDAGLNAELMQGLLGTYRPDWVFACTAEALSG